MTRLPSFIVIGAAKAATTWIAYQLRQRPDVFMPGPEPHYFSRCYDRGPAWYQSLFADADDTQMVGEKSADYLADPNVPRRIAALLPEVRLIAQLRNPIERAYSDYCMLFRRGQVSGDVDRQLDWAKTSAPRFLADGLYAQHIARFLNHVPADQLKIIFHDDIRSRPDHVLSDVCAMLRLPPIDLNGALDARINDAQAPLVPLALRRLPEPIKQLAAPMRGSATFRALRDLLARPVRYPPLSPDTRRRLVDFYHADVQTLAKMLGRDLTDWLAPAGGRS